MEKKTNKFCDKHVVSWFQKDRLTWIPFCVEDHNCVERWRKYRKRRKYYIIDKLRRYGYRVDLAYKFYTINQRYSHIILDKNIQEIVAELRSYGFVYRLPFQYGL